MCKFKARLHIVGERLRHWNLFALRNHRDGQAYGKTQMLQIRNPPATA